MTAKKIPLKRKMTEAQLHRAVAYYLAASLPSDVVWTTFPAGGGGKVRGAQLKSRGLRPGWPDVQLIYKGQFIGLELKTEKGALSDDQRACLAAIKKAGGIVFVCRNLDGVAFSLYQCGIPLRARVMAGSRQHGR